MEAFIVLGSLGEFGTNSYQEWYHGIFLSKSAAKNRIKWLEGELLEVLEMDRIKNNPDRFELEIKSVDPFSRVSCIEHARKARYQMIHSVILDWEEK